MKTQTHTYPLMHAIPATDRRPEPAFGLLYAWLRYAVAGLLRYHERQRQLNQLRSLDDRLLLDIGVTREEARLGRRAGRPRPDIV